MDQLAEAVAVRLIKPPVLDFSRCGTGERRLSTVRFTELNGLVI